MKLDQFQARMSEAASEVAKPRDALQKIALNQEGGGKRNAPVATGTLRRSITSRVDSPTTARVGSNLEYAPFIHDGTRYMEGRPFLTDAIDQNQAGIERALKDFGEAVLRKVAR